jgi:hypothetical protein
MRTMWRSALMRSSGRYYDDRGCAVCHHVVFPPANSAPCRLDPKQAFATPCQTAETVGALCCPFFAALRRHAYLRLAHLSVDGPLEEDVVLLHRSPSGSWLRFFAAALVLSMSVCSSLSSRSRGRRYALLSLDTVARSYPSLRGLYLQQSEKGRPWRRRVRHSVFSLRGG